MNNRYQLSAILSVFLIFGHYCHGQLDVKTAIEIVAPHLELSPNRCFVKDLDYPALAATNISNPNKSSRFFIDELNNKTELSSKSSLIFQAPQMLKKQFEESCFPNIKANPWFLYQGLEDFKKLRKNIAGFQTIFRIKSDQDILQKAKEPIMRMQFSIAFRTLLPQLSSIMIPTSNGKMDFDKLWLEATTVEERDFLLMSATGVIKGQKSTKYTAAVTRELIGFIGVLGHVFSEEKRMKSLIILNDLHPEYHELNCTVHNDILNGPTAKAIATMALQEKYCQSKK